jgi:hypothetical protein
VPPFTQYGGQDNNRSSGSGYGRGRGSGGGRREYDDQRGSGGGRGSYDRGGCVRVKGRFEVQHNTCVWFLANLQHMR